MTVYGVEWITNVHEVGNVERPVCSLTHSGRGRAWLDESMRQEPAVTGAPSGCGDFGKRPCLNLV